MATFNGTEGNDTIVGGADADVINGNGGNDSLLGGDGSDTVRGGAGNDFLSGNAGADWVEGGTGNDEVRGGSGQDSVAFHEFGAANADILSDFDAGWDNIQLDAAAFAAIGASGRMAAGDARFFAGTAAHDADDRIVYDQTTGQLWYDADGNGAGAQQLIATISNHSALSATDLWVFGSAPTGQHITGTAGDDSLTGGPGNDNIEGLGGNDTLVGLGGDDTLTGAAGNDSLSGGDGNDILAMGTTNAPGEDVFDGGAGINTADYSRAQSGVLADLGETGIHGGGADGSGHAAVRSIQNFIGGAFNDSISGNGIALSLANNVFDGGGGNDTLDGDTGNDTLTGGDGSDAFFFRGSGAATADVVRDFVSGTDKIWLEASAFNVVGNNIPISDASFYAAPGATAGHDADDRFVYNTTTGQLYYDSDGNGAATGQLIATLQGAPALAASDIVGGTPSGRPGFTVVGTAGDDSLVGGPGDDSLVGLGGNDTLEGREGTDTLDGGTGNDTYINANFDVIVDAAGIDTQISVDQSSVRLQEGIENLIVRGTTGTSPTPFAGGNELDNLITVDTTDRGIEINGGAGSDTLIGSNVATGGDLFFSSEGRDVVDGRAGNDALLLSGHGNLTVDMRAGTATGDDGADWGVTFSNIERIYSSTGNDLLIADDGGRRLVSYSGDDTLVGGAGNDTLASDGTFDFPSDPLGNDSLVGNGGNDVLDGGRGNDTLDGGAGNDTLSGGNDNDVYRFSVAPGAANADSVLNFESARDAIVLDSSVMTALGTPGSFSSGDERFYAAAGAASGHDVDDRVVYDTSTGNLYYDADGSGAGSAQLIANLRAFSGAPATLAASDIAVDNITAPRDQSIFGAQGNDSLTGGDGNDFIFGDAGNDTLNGGAGNDTIQGYTGDDSLIGGEGFDSLSGGDGNDTLDGWNSRTFDSDVQVDTMDGGLGNDVFMVDNVNDVLTDSGGVDTVISHDVDWTLAPGFENLTLRQDNDFPIHGTGNDQDNVIQANWFSVLDGRGGNDTILGSVQNDTLLGGDGNDSIAGGGDVDSIDGGAGDDTLDGGAFGDSDLTGGTGADHFVLAGPGQTPDRIHDFVGGTDKIRLDGTRFDGVGASGNFTAGDERFFAAPGASSAHDGTDRVIYNTATGEVFYDADGSGTGATAVRIATLPGLSATDIEVVNGTTPSPTPTPSAFPPASISGTSGNDNLSGTGGNDTIYGLGGNDTIFANSGNDWVVGGAGNDSLSGGSGQDTYGFAESGAANADTVANFDSAWDAIALDAGGFSAIGAAGRFSAGDVRFFAAAGATGGHDADDRIVFNTTTHQLFYDADGSGAGASQLIATFQGGANVAATDITVFGTATPSPTPSTTPTEGDDRLVGTNGNDSINGLGGNDTLVGLDGNDTLDGGPGVDSMDGGAGDDLYFVDNSNDTIFEAENGGIDEVRASAASYQLSPWVNNLTFTGTGAFIGVGNDIENVLTGGSGDDTFQGQGGNDTLNGGAGNDNLTGNGGDDVLNGGLGSDFLNDENGIDTFVFDAAPGDANADTIVGLSSGSDHIVIDGRAFTNIGPSGAFSTDDARFFAGAGATQGHEADDRIIFDTSTGRLYYDADGSGAGASQVFASVFVPGFFNPPQPGLVRAGDFVVVNGSTTPTPTPGTLNGTPGNDTLVGTDAPETINGLGGDDSIVGNGGADSMSGGDGNDTLNGWHARFSETDADVDTLAGGLGNDRFLVDNIQDVVVDAGGTDTVVAKNIDWTLGSGFENLVMNNGEVETLRHGTGNELDNLLDGRSGQVLATGGDGWHVSLSGLGGNDTLLGSAKDDTLLGGDGNDSLDGGQGVNTLDGGTGDDTLYGGRLGDSLETGGAGADRFALDFGGTARVTDFSSGVDKLRLDGNLFSSVGASGNYSAGDARFYSAAGATAAHDADDRFVYDSSTGNMYYDADGTGAGSAQFLGTLQGAPAIGATDVEVINGTSPTPTPTPGTSLNGTNNADTLVGGAGNDTIFGNSGNDWIEGRGGNDQLSGGSGQDSYVFREFGGGNADTLLNFDSNWDAMRFDSSAFTALGGPGHFAAGDARFFAGAGANAGHDADDRIVYNTSTGQLYYDADGAGGADAQLVASVQGAGAVAAPDIWVI